MKRKAFTIVETIVTLLAITIMVSGPLIFMYRSHGYGDLVLAKVVSFGLAQEGLELLTSYRNNNTLDFVNASSFCIPTCIIDWDGQSQNITLTSCASESCYRLYDGSINETYYKHNGSTVSTDFYRFLTITSYGTQSFVVESKAYTYVNGVSVAVVLKKVFSNVTVK